MTGAGTSSQTAQERISRHQYAAEILRARSILVVACSLWVVIGCGLYLATHHAIGSGSATPVVSSTIAWLPHALVPEVRTVAAAWMSLVR